MKKKIFIIFIVLLIIVAGLFILTGCSKKENNETNTANNEENTVNSESNSTNVDELTEEEKAISDAVSYKKDGNKIVFKIKTDAELEWNSSWLGLCPVGIYLTESAADDVDVYYKYEDGDTSDDLEKGIYYYTLDMDNIEAGIYTMVLTDSDNDGKVVGQWLCTVDAKKNITLNFKDGKLEKSKADTTENTTSQNEQSNSADKQDNISNEEYILDNTGLTADDIKTSVGNKVNKITGTSSQYVASVFCTDTKFETFEKWVNALAENCKKISKDGKLYQDEITWEEINAFELDSEALINVVQFIYKTNGHVVYVTASSSSDIEKAFNLNIQVY